MADCWQEERKNKRSFCPGPVVVCHRPSKGRVLHGNIRYLAWVYVQAANFTIRYNESASQASALDNEPPGLIGDRSFGITTRSQEMDRPGREPQGVGAGNGGHRSAQQLDARRCRDASGTVLLSGRSRQHRYRLIHMGDWCDSRNHTTKQRVRNRSAKCGRWPSQQTFIALVCEYVVCTVDYREANG